MLHYGIFRFFFLLGYASIYFHFYFINFQFAYPRSSKILLWNSNPSNLAPELILVHKILKFFFHVSNSWIWSNLDPYDYYQILSVFQAIDTRDALAKSIYASLFDWLVEQINKSLAVGKRRTGRSISILDIYGFESFDV